jgi:hypothetical protein
VETHAASIDHFIKTHEVIFQLSVAPAAECRLQTLDFSVLALFVPESAPGCIIATITRSDRIFMPQLDRVRAVLRTLQLQVCYTDIKVASSASTLRNTIRVKSRDFFMAHKYMRLQIT